MIQYFLNNLWLWKCGLPEKEENLKPSLDVLRTTEWSSLFEQLMRNRLIMGAIRYGILHEKDKPQYDRVSSMIKRLKKYEETGNKELLVDIANLCLCEFEECNHPTQFFYAIDEHTEHTNIIK